MNLRKGQNGGNSGDRELGTQPYRNRLMSDAKWKIIHGQTV